jgi:hypothetical protein
VVELSDYNIAKKLTQDRKNVGLGRAKVGTLQGVFLSLPVFFFGKHQRMKNKCGKYFEQ